jgi:fumigallin biosynthesis monooxygenase-like protein
MAEVKPGRWTAVIGARASRNLRRSCEHLERFANDRDDPHVAAWRNYWKRVGKDTRTGIWHETYLVRAGEYEAVYGNMPPFGLGKASSLVPMSEASSARARLKRRSAT